jgi:hypothetical protein
MPGHYGMMEAKGKKKMVRRWLRRQQIKRRKRRCL